MLNKRVATLLALVLAGSMVLSGPSMALAAASSGDSRGASQMKDGESEDPDTDDEAEDPEEDGDEDTDLETDEDTVKEKKDKKEKKTEKDTEDEKEAEESTVTPTVKAKKTKGKKAKKSTSGNSVSSTDKIKEEKVDEGLSRDGEDVSGNTADLPISGGVSGVDYSYDADADALIISTDTPLTITGSVSAASVIVRSTDGADLTLDGARIDGLHLEKAAGSVQIHLSGQNTLGKIEAEQFYGGKIYIDGPGVLYSEEGVKGTSRSPVITGGNIQIQPSGFPSLPVNGDGKPVYPVSIEDDGLQADQLYDLSVKVGSPLTDYPYGEQICTDENGGIMMRLPSGKVQVTLGDSLYEGDVDTSGSAPTELKKVGGSVSGDQQADPEKNGLVGIEDGDTFSAGVSINFYATGAGYGPKEPQELAPEEGATRYRPSKWSVGTLNSTWAGYTVKTDDEYRFGAAFRLNSNEVNKTYPYTLKVEYQKEVYDGKEWGAATDSDAIYTKEVDFKITTGSGSDMPDPDQTASPGNNKLYWINEGSTYRSGSTLQFYATGAGYGPEEPQDLNPVDGATRYVPVRWSVGTSSSGASGTSGSWTKYTSKTTGSGTAGSAAYTPGEYRFEGSFVVNTDQSTSVPYTLQVTYQREKYDADDKEWGSDGATDTKRVNFYIRNTSVTTTTVPNTYYPTTTPRYYATTTPYYRTGVTTTATRSDISSNARNATTMDDTPVGALAVLMMAAAGSGAVIFRRKRNRS